MAVMLQPAAISEIHNSTHVINAVQPHPCDQDVHGASVGWSGLQPREETIGGVQSKLATKLAPDGGVIVYSATCTLAVEATTPGAMIVTEADATLLGSTLLAPVTVAAEFTVR
jgi:hypothetical protein